ncbi:hypothetical protein STIAU_0835 [Stigmatella aurantiaca DW4/3-1]|uniref:Uncharacterized protein n=1 Tax=Stigmatella aurantiaca (strain DW4/3-1) TaxID=378806 RepID=Q097S1_STIAD|nr:hypothetical protein STIAU_0835 [Stigmatella aurantiaca DW4/3-1]
MARAGPSAALPLPKPPSNSPAPSRPALATGWESGTLLDAHALTAPAGGAPLAAPELLRNALGLWGERREGCSRREALRQTDDIAPQIEVLQHPPASIAAQPLGHVAIAEQPQEGARQRPGILLGDQQPCLLVEDQLWNGRDAGRHDGRFARQRLHERHGNALHLPRGGHHAGLDDHVRAGQQGRDLVATPAAQELDLRLDPGLLHLGFELPPQRTISDQLTPEARSCLLELAAGLDEVGVALVVPQARHAQDDRHVSAARARAGTEDVLIHPTAHHDDLPGGFLAVELHQHVPVELRDGHREGGRRELLVEHRPVDEQVMRMAGEAEAQARQPLDDEGRQRRVGGPVRMHVLDLEPLHLPREERRLRNHRESPHEKAPRVPVARERHPPSGQVPQRAVPQPIELGRHHGPGDHPPVMRPGNQLAGTGVPHRAVAAEQRKHLHLNAQPLELEDLVEDECLRDRRKPRHQVGDAARTSGHGSAHSGLLRQFLRWTGRRRVREPARHRAARGGGRWHPAKSAPPPSRARPRPISHPCQAPALRSAPRPKRWGSRTERAARERRHPAPPGCHPRGWPPRAAHTPCPPGAPPAAPRSARPGRRHRSRAATPAHRRPRPSDARRPPARAAPRAAGGPPPRAHFPTEPAWPRGARARAAPKPPAAHPPPFRVPGARSR